MNNLRFLNTDWLLPVLLTATILLIVFIWKEWRVSGNRRFLLKSFLALLAIGSLALIALKPVRLVEAEKNKFIILTPGYTETQLDSLQKETKKLEIIRYEPGEPIIKEENKITSAFILGHGISSFDLWQLDGISSKFLPGESPGGVLKLSYKQENLTGKPLNIQGRYKNSEKGTKLILEGPAGRNLDSISFEDSGLQNFSLKTILKAKGNFLYSLVEMDSSDNIIGSNPVPVKVKDRKLLKILVLNAYPTFETKYLKNFLAESGHEISLRSQLTRGSFKLEYFNTEPLQINTLSEEILQNFDLLIIDAIELTNMAGRTRDNIKKAVREQGLGVFIQADINFLNSPDKFSELNFTTNRNIEINLEEYPEVALETHPFGMDDDLRIQAIHESNGRIISGYKKLQNGRIGSSVFQNTYKMLLNGNDGVYQALWSKLIEGLAKTENPVSQWNSDSFMAFKNEPFSIKIRTSLQDPEIIDEHENEIPIKAGIDIPMLWEGTTYPREEGWQYLSASLDSTSGFYYYTGNTKDWASLRAEETRRNNKRYFSSELKENALQSVQQPLNLIWFYIIVLLSLGFLWLEPKIMSS